MKRAVVAALFVASQSACADRVCIDRGKLTVYEGSYTYSTSAGDSGAAASELRIDDFDPYENGTCDTAHAEFTMTVGTCKLVAYATNAEHDTGKNASGDFLSAAADLAPAQTCTLSLAGKPTELTVDGGGLSLTPGNAVLNLTAHSSSAPSNPVDTVTITFRGNQ